jgi:hypothetical protein
MRGRFAVAVLLASSARAYAEPRDPVTAEALFREARDAVAKGDFATACPKFRESQRLDPSVGTLMNIADCEEHEGHLAKAWETWHEALDHLLHAGDDRAKVARERALALEPRLPKLVVRVPAGLTGAQVTRDGVELGPPALGVAVPVDLGAHRVALAVPGRRTSERTVTLAEGQTLDVFIAPGALEDRAPGPAPPAPREEPSTSRRTLGFVALGASAAGLVTAVVSGLAVAHDKSVVDGECDATRACSQAGVDAAHAGKTWLVVNAVSSIVALASIGAGVFLLLTSHRGDR